MLFCTVCVAYVCIAFDFVNCTDFYLYLALFIFFLFGMFLFLMFLSYSPCSFSVCCFCFLVLLVPVTPFLLHTCKLDFFFQTIGDNTLYTYPEKKDNSLANPLKQDQRSAAPRNKTTRRPLPQPMGEHGDLITEITPSTRSSADNYKKKKQLDPLGIEASENIDLNSTMMFTLNSSAKLMADGSLDYSSQDAFRSLPLTPVPFRRRADVPPLDLTALRSSTDSLMSSNTFQPYSGTVRSTDTYRVNERQSYQLQSVPEGNMDAII